jgi:predicted amidohydrolase
MMTLTVALVRDVFHDVAGVSRLTERLREARTRGAALAVVPELPLNSWAPASVQARDEDAEDPGGPRFQVLANAARTAGIGIVGGAIIRDPSRRRHNTALVFDAKGELIASYRKVHLPEEEGFWETSHYEPGDALAAVVDRFPMRIGIQICSDINRPEGSHVLGALGAEAIVNPRATEAATFDRWRTVLIANALTSGAYVLSVPRPYPEFDVPLGGPSFAVAPTGDILTETTEAVAIVTLDRAIVEHARKRYPAYLATRADLYAEGWRKVTTTKRPHEQ